jgi:SAM-dependent methyltransferase
MTVAPGSRPEREPPPRRGGQGRARRLDPYDPRHWRAEWAIPSWGNQDANLRFLEATGRLRPGARILEIGCGRGPMLQALWARGLEAIGIDRDEGLQRTWDHRGRVCVATGTALPFPERCFDLVLSFDVFEHIPDSEAHLREVGRVLRRPGHYLLQTPNKWTNLPVEALTFARKFGIRYVPDAFRPPGHCALHSLGGLLRRLRRHGFAPRPVEVPIVTPYFVDKMRRLFGRAGALALRLVDPDRLPLAWRPSLYVEAALDGPGTAAQWIRR